MDSFGFGWFSFFWFIACMFGYWMGRDARNKPLTLAESGAPIVYGWALVGVLSCFMGGAA